MIHIAPDDLTLDRSPCNSTTPSRRARKTNQLVPILVGIMCSTGYAYAAVANAKSVFRDQVLVKDIQMWLVEAGLHGRVRTTAP